MLRLHVIFVLLLFGISFGCRPTPTEPAAPVPEKFLFEDAINNPTLYLSEKLSAKEYKAQKKQEAKALLKHAKEAYKIKFKIKQSKYLNFVYTCTEKEAKRFFGSAQKFFLAVYPKYFKYEPKHVINIVYFRNLPQYDRITQSDSFGYYMENNGFYKVVTYPGALEGTLWHELVHAFEEAAIDYEAQQWFSEGFASFYDSGYIKGKEFAEGYANWRMPGLHKEVKNNTIPPLKLELARENMSMNFSYAAAKFFFLYLYSYGIQKDFVNFYYHKVLPGNKATRGKAISDFLESKLGKSMAEVDKDFRATALKYYPGQRMKIKKPKPVTTD